MRDRVIDSMLPPSPLRIELARAADIPAILALSNAAAERSHVNFATEPESLDERTRTFEATRAMYPWVVARDGSSIVGFAKGAPHRTRGAYLWTAEVAVYVDPRAHRRGIGRALYARLIPTMRAQGYVTLLAGIALPNDASVKLHEAFGFVQCATFHRAGWKLGAWRDVGYWELSLRPGDDAPPAALRDVASAWSG
jgi:phosphinothricin acetyltransferase